MPASPRTVARVRFRPLALPSSIALAAAALALVACPPHEDVTPQIEVQPGAAKRAMWIGSHAPATTPRAAPARVHPMRVGDELGGPNAIGRPGDLLLENDEIAVVIDQLGSSAGFAESGGNLVDAADARERKDELGQLFSFFGTFPRQGVYTSLASGTGDGGVAWVEARGHELYEPKLAVTTRYSLRPGDRALLIETTATNEGAAPIGPLAVGDAIQWGGAEKVAPGKALGFKGASRGAYVGGVGRLASYAITSTEGGIEALSGGSWTDTFQARDVTIAPGKSVQYARVFVVGPRADLAGVVAELTRASGGAVGEVAVHLVDEAGRAIAAPAGAKAVLANDAGEAVLSMRAMHEGAAFGGEVPPGKYLLGYASGGGRKGIGPKVPIVVAAGRATEATLPVSAPASLAFRCVRAEAPATTLPCKVTIEPLDGAPAPDFGPPHVAGAAGHQITTDDGEGKVAIAPGKYRVTGSRGPEYALAQKEVEARAGDPGAPVELPIARVVDTAGYLATDFHQHTMLGADAPVATQDRVIANAAEGVEVAVASEHNVVADFTPIVRARKLDAELVSIAGDELTSDASRAPWGHANVFPLAVDPNRPRGGAPVVRDRTAKELFTELRALKAPHVLQVNHPRTGITGYFDLYKFDPATGEGKDPGYDPSFDALEVWNGRNVDGRARVTEDFFALLRTSHPVTATADTDTHGIVGQEAGYPRTYVRVADDGHLASWDASRSNDLVDGVRGRRDVVLTNGPFLRVRAGKASIGGVAQARGGALEVRVHVEAAPWVDVDRVALVRASTPATPETRRVTLRPLPTGAHAADVTFTLRFAHDDAFVVAAMGSTPMRPVLDGDPAEITPYAMTGALWVDADGDGRALGR